MPVYRKCKSCGLFFGGTDTIPHDQYCSIICTSTNPIPVTICEYKVCSKCKEPRPLSDFLPGRKCCRTCRRSISSAYYYAHKDQVRATSRAWKKKNKEHVYAQSKEWRVNNPDKVSESERKRKGSKERKDHSRRFYRRNHERIKQYQKEYNRKNPDKLRTRHESRRARLKGSEICDLTQNQWRQIKGLYQYRCAYCGLAHEFLTKDHVIPISKGGNHTMSNIVPACQSCNSKKGVKLWTPMQPHELE